MQSGNMRRFELFRKHDVSGVSGTGVIAEGVEFTDGTVVMKWISDLPSSVIFHDGIKSVEHVHGHNGKTIVRWID